MGKKTASNFLKPPKENPNCKGCFYHIEIYGCSGFWVCNYMCVTGQRRGCPSTNCNKYKPINNKM